MWLLQGNLFILFCLKKPSTTDQGFCVGRDREVKEAEILQTMIKLLPFCIFANGIKHPVMILQSHLDTE